MSNKLRLLVTLFILPVSIAFVVAPNKALSKSSFLTSTRVSDETTVQNFGPPPFSSSSSSSSTSYNRGGPRNGDFDSRNGEEETVPSLIKTRNENAMRSRDDYGYSEYNNNDYSNRWGNNDYARSGDVSRYSNNANGYGRNDNGNYRSDTYRSNNNYEVKSNNRRYGPWADNRNGSSRNWAGYRDQSNRRDSSWRNSTRYGIGRDWDRFDYDSVRNSVPFRPEARTITIDGGALRTWSITNPDMDRARLELSSQGGPVWSEIQLWQGPGHSPVHMDVYLENGASHPLRAVIATPAWRGTNTIAVRNSGPIEFPSQASVEGESTYDNGGLGSVARNLDRTGRRRMLQGGSTGTFVLEPHVNNAHVLIDTDGRPLNARIELMQGPNNCKQEIELYSEDGFDRPFFMILETPGVGNVIRIINTATIEFPITATVESNEGEVHYTGGGEYGRGGGLMYGGNRGSYNSYGAGYGVKSDYYGENGYGRNNVYGRGGYGRGSQSYGTWRQGGTRSIGNNDNYGNGSGYYGGGYGGGYGYGRGGGFSPYVSSAYYGGRGYGGYGGGYNGYGGYSDASYGYGGRGGGYYAGEYIGTNGGGVQGWETLLNRNRFPYQTNNGNFVF